ncbi:MAG TPA: hypothetical protein VGV59_18730 [Pyrinomonadaceae bacterium]|nr:hypothetical protein [Pyrinomonadaceae bacterium]
MLRQSPTIIRLFALSLVALFMAACGGARAPQTPPVAQKEAPKAKTFDVHVLEDEAMPKGSQAVIGGTVRNISGERLENVVVELELVRRDGKGTETRSLPLAPAVLEPGAEGRYSITVLPKDWKGSHILRLKSSTRPDELAFKSEVGARRPPERIQPARERIVVRPKPKKGDDYLNTPETADQIR